MCSNLGIGSAGNECKSLYMGQIEETTIEPVFARAGDLTKKFPLTEFESLEEGIDR